MKRLSAIFTAGVILFFSSCNDSSKEKEEAKTADTTAVTPVPPTPPEATFTPFKIFSVKHHVKDFTKWEAAYMSHDSMRQTYGVTNYRLGRGLEDSNTVLVVDKINDVQRAKEFAGSATLKDAMMKAGVIGKPDVSYWEVIRNDSSKLENNDRMTITHKVKDFAAWVKVFDAEGKAKRAEYGLIDRAMGRSLDDSNTVRLVFAVSDMAKAKARGASPELKKLMEDAGVIGKPDVFFYRIVQ